MFEKLIDLIKQALKKMLGYADVKSTLTGDVYGVSEDMSKAISLWVQMYKNESPWLDIKKGVYSLNLASEICSEVARMIMIEVKSEISEPGVVIEDIDDSKEEDVKITRASFLNRTYHSHLLKHLRHELEKGIATGGMIIKPYVVGEKIFYDFSIQGEFVPIKFNDDGIITDIAFLAQFIDGKKKYTKVERHIFDETQRTVTIINKAYVADVNENEDDDRLGVEIPLSNVERWSFISEGPVIIQSVEKPLYGYYKVSKANNIDLKSPLGVSIFSRAVGMIERADMQFSRLDWEFEGGQLAIDVDPTALVTTPVTADTKYMTRQAQLKERLYRGVDVGTDDTYHEFAPTLRNDNFESGLNSYLTRIEDLCEISRGTISDVQVEARTATEIKILKQRSYATITNNQQSLDSCLQDVIYATNVYADLYSLAPEGEYEMNTEWSDSILTDSDTQLEQKLNLVDKDILSKAEVRAWYTGESIETAQKKIDDIAEENESNLSDIFTMGKNNNPTLESGE